MRGFYRLTLLYRAIRTKILLRRALRAVARYPQVRSKTPHGLGARVVITLTSYPARFNHLSKTLRSLLDQTTAPDDVQLWIAEEDMAALPAEVGALAKAGLSIRPCRDLKSYKKLVPALERDAAAIHITADDDVYYPPDWLGRFVDAARDHPSTVIAMRSHMASRKSDGTLAPYAEWELAADRLVPEEPREALFPTGVGGVLYPPGCFDPRVLDEDTFMELCPRGDDIWLFWMARLAGTRHRRAPGWFDIVEWPGSQSVALYAANLHDQGNDRQIRAMEKRFGPLPEVSLSQEAL
ncbi:MAG: glycosyltransferase family 2 protein [Pseudomonadota bacterium]